MCVLLDGELHHALMTHFLQKDTSESPENCKKLAEFPTNLANTSFTDAAQILSYGTNDLTPQREYLLACPHTLPHTTNYTNMTKRQQNPPSSPTNVNVFPSEGWMN
jgi:hypothetical protein